MKLALLLFFAACAPVDGDLDGVVKGADCDDADATVGVGVGFYADADGDGFGDAASETRVCEAPAGFVRNGEDCDDADPAIHPDAVELCDSDNVDEDCDDLADDDDPGVDDGDKLHAWEDSDGDGYGSGADDGYFCDVPANYVSNLDDCDDGDPSVGPMRAWYLDSDGDRYGDPARAYETCTPAPGYVLDGTDCDDAQDDVNPSARELCDGEDDDCDGVTDEPDAVDAPTWYADADADGHGDAAASVVQCEAPAGQVAVGDDCDDTSAAVSPSRVELCDAANVDEDCDTLADDADPGAAADGMVSWYADTDGDAYGDAAVGLLACDAPVGFVADTTDCDDTAALTNPGGTEVCDPDDADEDCDGTWDDGDLSTDPASWITWHLDWDRDGYGSDTLLAVECDVPDYYIATGGDCDDYVATVNPLGTEVCDAANADEDCDGLADDADASVDPTTHTTFWADADADGFGDPASATDACDVPTGHVADASDCDAADPAIHPDAVEVCGDGVDDNCDGSTDCVRDSSDADRGFWGESHSDRFGRTVASAGDQDGDGIDDLLVGATGSDRGGSGSGAAYVIRGGETGDLDAADAAVVLEGESADDYAGSCVASMGDTDGDGYDDFVVGAQLANGSGGLNAGKVYLVRGPQAGTVDLASAHAILYADASGDYAGEDCQNAGDVNGDGLDDLIIGADGYSSLNGAAYVVTSLTAGSTRLTSTATIRLTGESSDDSAGVSVDGAGDLDGDGQDDFLVGAYGDDDGGSNAGAVYVFQGPHSADGSLSTADAKLRGETASSYAGGLVRGLGDLDGDGYADIGVGADSYGDDGIVYVVRGPISASASLSTAVARIEGTSGHVGTGFDAADVDGDGYGDVAIANGSAETTVRVGAVYLLRGPLAGAYTTDDADSSFTGAMVDEGFGADVAFVGSQDGLGTYDLLVGASGYTAGTAETGAAWLFSLTGI